MYEVSVMDGFVIRTRIRPLTEGQSREHLRRIAQLRAMGVEVGDRRDFLRVPPTRETLRLEPVDSELAGIYDLPGDGLIFVAHARLTTLASIVLVEDFEMSVPWDELPLELEEPEGFSFYADCIAGFYPLPLKIINPWITGRLVLRRGRHDGLIIARGRRSIPVKYQDHELVTVNLSVWDERENETSFTLAGRVDRSIKRKYERRTPEVYRRDSPRRSIFGRDLPDLATERTPVKNSSSVEHGPAEPHPRTSLAA